MKKRIPVLVAIISMIALPAGMAMALEVEGGSNTDVGVQTGVVHTNAHAIVGVHINAEDQSDKGGDDATEGGKPVPMLFNEGDGHGASDMHATSTRSHEDGNKGKEGKGEDKHATSTEKNGNGFGKGGIRAFLSWIFGLPASTTIGDLRAEVTASTSASVSHSQGLGFWGRIFGLFGVHND